MQGNARSVWFNNCVVEQKFLRKQIEIVNPRAVVGLGRLAFESILRSFDLVPLRKESFSKIVKKEGVRLPGSRARAFAVYHCGAAGWHINRPIKEHYRDWQKVGKMLKSKKDEI